MDDEHEYDSQKKIVIWQIVSQYGLGDEKKAVLRYSLAVLGSFHDESARYRVCRLIMSHNEKSAERYTKTKA
jgi:hypothetical protein